MTNRKQRIAIGGHSHETNTFSPVWTTNEDFRLLRRPIFPLEAKDQRRSGVGGAYQPPARREVGAQTVELGPDVVDTVREMTGGRGADVVLEGVGSPEAGRLAVIARGARRSAKRFQAPLEPVGHLFQLVELADDDLGNSFGVGEQGVGELERLGR